MWSRNKNCKRPKKTAAVAETEPEAVAESERSDDAPALTDRLRTVMTVLDLNAQAALDLLPDTDPDTMAQLAAVASDPFGKSVHAFLSGIAAARAAMLQTSTTAARDVLTCMAKEEQWHVTPSQNIFHKPKRRLLGKKQECFLAHGLPVLRARSPFLAQFFASNQSSFVSVVDSIRLPSVSIDMCFVNIVHADESESTYQLQQWCASDATEEPSAIPRTAELFLARRERQRLLHPSLLLVVASLLVPPCAASHRWKTCIVASGNRAKTHIVDKICAELVDLGIANDVSELGLRRSQPYVLYVSQWKGPSSAALIKSKLSAGFVVVVRSDAGVPPEICLDADLRLTTVHMSALSVADISDDVWQRDKVNLFLDALDAYSDHVLTATTASLRVPFVRAEDMIPYRPVPRAAIHASLFSEMLHGGVLVCVAHKRVATLDALEKVYEEYARRRGFVYEIAITPEAILEGAAMVKTSVDDVVKFCAATKTFSNLLVLEEGGAHVVLA